MRGRGVFTYLDATGASMSTLCTIHCALSPMTMGLLPVISFGILTDEKCENVLLSLSASLGIINLYLGYRAHRSRSAVAAMTVGLGLLASGRVAEGWKCERIGLTLIVGGGMIVSLSHLWNRRLDLLFRVKRDGVRLKSLSWGRCWERRSGSLNPEKLP